MRALNDAGVVIGVAHYDHVDYEGQPHTLIYRFAWSDGEVQIFAGASPMAINNLGEAVGVRFGVPYRWAPGAYEEEPQEITTLSTYFSGYHVEIRGINDVGEVLGRACRNAEGPFYCNRTGEKEIVPFLLIGDQVLVLPLPDGLVNADVNDLNEAGEATGWAMKSDGSGPRPLIWTTRSESGAREASVALLPTRFARGKETPARARAINNNGWIAGQEDGGELVLWEPAESSDGGGDSGCTHPSGKCK